MASLFFFEFVYFLGGDMKIRMDALPEYKFAPASIVDCIDKPLRYNDKVVGIITDYEIINGKLIIECEIHDEGIIKEMRDNGSLPDGWYGDT